VRPKSSSSHTVVDTEEGREIDTEADSEEVVVEACPSPKATFEERPALAKASAPDAVDIPSDQPGHATQEVDSIAARMVAVGT
jgi:hypothetical protein